MPGWSAGPDRDPAHPAVSDVVADLEAERVAIEGQGCVRVVVREEGPVNGDLHAGQASRGGLAGASRFLTSCGGRLVREAPVRCRRTPRGARR